MESTNNTQQHRLPKTIFSAETELIEESAEPGCKEKAVILQGFNRDV